MLLQRDTGIAVRPGAIDFLALTRPPPSLRSLASRATNTTQNIWITTGVILLVALVACGIFCCVVLCCMHRTKQRRKKQTLDLGRTHRYQPVDNNVELAYGGVQELPVDYDPGHKAELDGYIAAPKRSAQPAELPSSGNYKDGFR